MGRFFDPRRADNLLITLHVYPEQHGFESRWGRHLTPGIYPVWGSTASHTYEISVVDSVVGADVAGVSVTASQNTDGAGT